MHASCGLIDPWALADRTFQLEEDDYPFEIALQDYDGDGTTDTLIKVRKHSYYGDRIFKIFLDQASSACQILRFSNCEPPEKG